MEPKEDDPTADYKQKLNITSSGAGQVCAITYHDDPANFMALKNFTLSTSVTINLTV